MATTNALTFLNSALFYNMHCECKVELQLFVIIILQITNTKYFWLLQVTVHTKYTEAYSTRLLILKVGMKRRVFSSLLPYIAE